METWTIFAVVLGIIYPLLTKQHSLYGWEFVKANSLSFLFLSAVAILGFVIYGYDLPTAIHHSFAVNFLAFCIASAENIFCCQLQTSPNN